MLGVRRTSHRLSIQGLTLLVLVLAASACGGSAASGPKTHTPEAATRGFFDAILRNDLDAFTAHQSASMSPQTRTTLLNAFSKWQSQTDSAKDAIRITQLATKLNSDISAEVNVVFKSGSPNVVMLKKESDSWLVVSVQ